MPWTFQQTVPVAQSTRQKCGSALLDWLCHVPNAIYPTEPQWWGSSFPVSGVERLQDLCVPT